MSFDVHVSCHVFKNEIKQPISSLFLGLLRGEHASAYISSTLLSETEHLTNFS